MKSLLIVAWMTTVASAECRIVDALPLIRPSAQWNLRGDGYNGLEWLDAAQSKPSLNEIQNAIARCQSDTAARATLKAQARVDARNTQLPEEKRLQALLVLLDLDR